MEQTLLNHKRYKGVYKYVMKNLLTLKKNYYDCYHSFFSSYELGRIVNEFEVYKSVVKQMNEKTNMNTLILRHQLFDNCNKDIVGYFMTFVRNKKLIELKDVLEKKQEMYETISRILANKANMILRSWKRFRWRPKDEEKVNQYFKIRIKNEVDFLKIRKDIINSYKKIKEYEEEEEYDRYYCSDCGDPHQRCRCYDPVEYCGSCGADVDYCHCRSDSDDSRRYGRRRGRSDSSDSW